jgi:hypothetical protein
MNERHMDELMTKELIWQLALYSDHVQLINWWRIASCNIAKYIWNENRNLLIFRTQIYIYLLSDTKNRVPLSDENLRTSVIDSFQCWCLNDVLIFFFCANKVLTLSLTIFLLKQMKRKFAIISQFYITIHSHQMRRIDTKNFMSERESQLRTLLCTSIESET